MPFMSSGRGGGFGMQVGAAAANVPPESAEFDDVPASHRMAAAEASATATDAAAAAAAASIPRSPRSVLVQFCTS